MDLLKYSEAAEFVHLSEITMRKLVSKRKIPHVKILSRVFFKPADLEAWVESKHVPAVAQ